MTPAGPNRRGPSARRAHRQACARSANFVRCSGLTPKVLKPTRTADIARQATRRANYGAGRGEWWLLAADRRLFAQSRWPSSQRRSVQNVYSGAPDCLSPRSSPGCQPLSRGRARRCRRACLRPFAIGNPGQHEVASLHPAGCCPGAEQNGMSKDGRVLLQLGCQPLQEILRAYLLGGGHPGALD